MGAPGASHTPTVAAAGTVGVAKAAGDALALRAVLAQDADLATQLAAYDETRRAVGNEIAAYGRELGKSFA